MSKREIETISVKDAAQMLKVTNTRVYQLIKKKEIHLFNGVPTLDSVKHYKKNRKLGRPVGSFKKFVEEEKDENNR